MKLYFTTDLHPPSGKKYAQQINKMPNRKQNPLINKVHLQFFTTLD